MTEQIRFHEILEAKLRSTIKKFIGRDLKPSVLKELRDAMVDDVTRVFNASNVKLTENALSWVGTQYFKTVNLNDNGIMAELVIVNDFKLADFPDADIETLYNLFNTAWFGEEVEQERARRRDGKEQVQ